MRKCIKAVAVTLAAVMLFGTVAMADTVSMDKEYLSLGADLNQTEKAKVMELLDVDKDEMEEYEILTVTNEEEHRYLDNYVDKSVIGTRALSSVLIEKSDPGKGIEVETENISYCTPGMYENALATAGVTDAEIKVAGPMEISGTAALVGIMKAYEEMTGEEITEEVKDTATNELIVTGSLAETLKDSDKAEELVAYIKDQIGNRSFESEDDIMDFVDECADKFEIKLSEEDRTKIQELIKKFENMDLDMDQIKEQVSKIYDKVKDLNLGSVVEKTGGFLADLFGGLSNWINSLLGK